MQILSGQALKKNKLEHLYRFQKHAACVIYIKDRYTNAIPH